MTYLISLNPMHRKAAILGVSIAAALFTTITPCAANAQSEEEHFEGASIGVQAGWEDRKIDETVLPHTLNVTLSDKRDGVAYGGYAGYDQQFGNFVIGAEAGFSLGGKTLAADIPGGSIKLDSKWSADLSIRAGVAVTPRLLAYGRVGYSLNRYRIGGFESGNSTALASEGETADGIVFGGGLEYALPGKASIRAEYRRKKLDGSLTSNQVLGGVTLRF
jgi:outer membrane immunogenic protein